MARPIEATPTLNRKESEEFIKNMLKVQRRKKPIKSDQFFIDAILANRKLK